MQAGEQEVRKRVAWDEADPEKPMILEDSLSPWDFVINDMEGGYSRILDREVKWIDFHF